jgi:hypothetical protein
MGLQFFDVKAFHLSLQLPLALAKPARLTAFNPAQWN